MTVSCAVVGQSNSIISGGFVDLLRRKGTVAVERLGRIGASPSIVAPFFMSDGFLAGCDYCLLDFCVVDLSAIRGGTYSYRSSLIWAEWACHQARRNNCEPILVIIPPGQDIGARHPLTQMYREVAQRLSCYFLDVSDIVVRLRGSTGASLDSLYMDAAHPGEAVSHAMAAIIERFMLAEPRSERRKERFCAAVRSVERLSLVELAGCCTPISRAGSLLSFRGVDLMREQTLRLPTGAFTDLVGVLVNAAACTHDAAFTGSRRLVKQLTLRPYTRTDFEVRLVPFNATIRDGSGFLTVSVSHPGEIWEDQTMQAVSGGIMPHRLEIADILVERGIETVDYEAWVPVARGELDLSRLF